jgi:hypothetical protein
MIFLVALDRPPPSAPIRPVFDWQLAVLCLICRLNNQLIGKLGLARVIFAANPYDEWE